MDAAEDLEAIMADLPQIKADIAFARALRQLTIITVTGEIHLQLAPNAQNVVIDLRSLSASGQLASTQIPSTTGHAGSALLTDGNTVFWS
jgi:S-adenosylhomocysteine hydrolase